jgi:hypothetical protein
MKNAASFDQDNSKIYLKYSYLMYPVGLKIEPKVNIGDDVFYAKKSFHISLLCLEKFSENEQIKILKFAQKYPINLGQVSTTTRMVTKDDQKSIIVRVRMTGLRKMIKEINQNFGYKFENPPTHITLYTLKNQFGIPINLTEDLRNLSQAIVLPDSQLHR